MKWKRSSAVAIAALALSAGSLQTASAAEGDEVSATPVEVTTLAQVTPLGLKVTGVALEYDGDLGADEVPISAFGVETDLPSENPDADPADVARTITSVYTSPSPQFHDEPAAGNYLILELSEEDHRAGGTSFDGTFTQMLDLDDALAVTQMEDIALPGGEIAAAPDTAYESTNSLRLIVDDYATEVLDASNGIELPYRLFSPDTDAQVPLVVSLHGHGESGTNNMSQIVGNQISVAFADPARQETNPAYVLSPQTQQGEAGGADGVGWWIPEWQDAVIELVEKTIAENPNIDQDRVYLTGLSMGSFGSWAILPNHSDLFAAAILVTGAGDEATAVETLSDFPIWALHSVDDFVVPYDAPGSDYRIFQELEAAGSPVVWS
ncbi:MAG TPA: hypothetical protein VK096_04630, partial [Actinomycetales bacterium]|nr:hypothetical protein [Actinomycetales bacterium]